MFASQTAFTAIQPIWVNYTYYYYYHCSQWLVTSTDGFFFALPTFGREHSIRMGTFSGVSRVSRRAMKQVEFSFGGSALVVNPRLRLDNIAIGFLKIVECLQIFTMSLHQFGFFVLDTVDGSEIPNNHLGWCKNLIKNGRNYKPRLASWISSINSSSRPPTWTSRPPTWTSRPATWTHLTNASGDCFCQLRW